MSRAQKRRTRMVASLAAAVLLAAALAWTSFTASSQAVTPEALIKAGASGGAYQLTGKVVAGYHREGQTLVFGVRDRDSPAVVRVRYRGSVPDPFRAGREVIVTVRREGGAWIGERDSLITKCPSKFTTKPDAR
jgi:cytochrome c-type biogenesis protein CcmE